MQNAGKSWPECYVICVPALNQLLLELLQFSEVTSVAKVQEGRKTSSFTFIINYIII